MDDLNPSHWRNLFERSGGQPPTPRGPNGRTVPPRGYDDGYQPPPDGGGDRPPHSSGEIADEDAMALGLDATEYRPWLLQRGRSRPAMMLHLRRFEAKSGDWIGWHLSYPHLIAVEYIGDKMLSLDLGTRQFIIEGTGLIQLGIHLQQGSVLMVQEYAAAVWPDRSDGQLINLISRVHAART